MTPTQPKDAEMDEKIRGSAIAFCENWSDSTLSEAEYSALSHAYESGANWAKNYYEATLSEERARFEEKLEIALSTIEIGLERAIGGFCTHPDGAPDCVWCRPFIEAIDKLKSPGERDQPTEDKSGVRNE